MTTELLSEDHVEAGDIADAHGITAVAREAERRLRNRLADRIRGLLENDALAKEMTMYDMPWHHCTSSMKEEARRVAKVAVAEITGMLRSTEDR